MNLFVTYFSFVKLNYIWPRSWISRCTHDAWKCVKNQTMRGTGYTTSLCSPFCDPLDPMPRTMSRESFSSILGSDARGLARITTPTFYAAPHKTREAAKRLIIVRFAQHVAHVWQETVCLGYTVHNKKVLSNFNALRFGKSSQTGHC